MRFLDSFRSNVPFWSDGLVGVGGPLDTRSGLGIGVFILLLLRSSLSLDATRQHVLHTKSMITQRERMRAHGVFNRWFAEVSGLGLAEHATRLVHPDPPEKQNVLAENTKRTSTRWRHSIRSTR